MRLHYAETASFGVTPEKQPISVASHRKRIFCESCNEHFKHLEDKAIPIIEPMGHGHRVTLGREEREVVALWGAKTGMALIATIPEFRELVPLTHRLVVRQQARVPDELFVAYCAWRGGFNKTAGDHSLVGEHDPSRGYRAYGAILTFAHLALKVFGFISYPVAGHTLYGDRPSIKQLWPDLGEPIEWPPAAPVANDRNLRGLVEFVPLEPIA